MPSSQPARTGQAVVLTAVTMSLLALVAFVFGTFALALMLVPLPVALVLLWSSTDVRRADEEHPFVSPVRPADSNVAMGYGRMLEH